MSSPMPRDIVPTPINASGVSTAFIYPTQVGQGQGVSDTISSVPDSINTPIIFEPPPALAGDDLNVEIIATGTNNWGGCEVNVSLDNITYGMVGTIFAGGVQGLLTTALPAGSDPDTTNTFGVDVTMSQGQVNPAAQIYADDFLALAYVDGEIIAYTNATLTSNFNYTFGTYMRRGVYGTANAAHATGTQFGLITGTTFRQRFPYNLIGQTIYLKFPSFNTLGLQLQALSDVTVYTYTLQGKGVAPNPWFQSWSVGGKFTDFVLDPWDGNYEIFDVQAPVALVFANNLRGSPQPGCETPPSTAVSLPIQVIRASGGAAVIGSVNFAPGATAGTYNVPTSFNLAIGDRLRLYAVPTTDNAISGCYGTIVGSQSV